MQRSISFRHKASSSVQESGGKPPLLSPRLIAPRVGWNLIPISLHHALACLLLGYRVHRSLTSWYKLLRNGKQVGIHSSHNLSSTVMCQPWTAEPTEQL